MNSKFAAKRRGTLNKFFTKASVGQLLAEQLGSLNPARVVDLGAGEGSLSASVVARWPTAKIVTVDIDPSTNASLHKKLEEVGCDEHTHFVHNALDPSLPDLVGANGSFDLAVCNPPFFRPPWSRDYADILQSAGMEDACGSVAEVTAEILFLAQSLTLLGDGGKLAIIVPDSLITTDRAKNFRKALLCNHAVEKVIQLPLNSFLETDAQCFIIILDKGGNSAEGVQLINVDADHVFSEPFVVNFEDAIERLDFNFHVLQQNRSGRYTTLRELGAEIYRGSISTVERKTAYYPVFHTSDYKFVSDGKIELPVSNNLHHFGKIVAAAGDILMARVDRNLHEKIGIVTVGSAILTDCVYRIRVPEGARHPAYAALLSETGRANLRARTKGVGARIIGKADLLDMPLYMSGD